MEGKREDWKWPRQQIEPEEASKAEREREGKKNVYVNKMKVW